MNKLATIIVASLYAFSFSQMAYVGTYDDIKIVDLTTEQVVDSIQTLSKPGEGILSFSQNLPRRYSNKERSVKKDDSSVQQNHR